MLSFSDMKLDDIVNKVTSGVAKNDIDFSIKPVYRESLKYITQFKESNFSFINRLSSEYGEFFYYDGRVLHFGKPSEQKSVKLVHGQNLNVMNMAVRILPMGFSYFSYRSEENSTLDAQAPGHVEGLNGFSQHALAASSSVFDNSVNHPIKPRVENKSQLDKLAEKHKAAMASNLSDITGESTNTALNIGSIADVYVSRKNDTGVLTRIL